MKLVRIAGPCTQGTKVPKPPGNPAPGRSRNEFERFYNATGEPFETEIPWDSWCQSLLRDGSIRLVEDRPEKPAPKKDVKS